LLGCIWADSEGENLGSTFYIQLTPLALDVTQLDVTGTSLPLCLPACLLPASLSTCLHLHGCNYLIVSFCSDTNLMNLNATHLGISLCFFSHSLSSIILCPSICPFCLSFLPSYCCLIFLLSPTLSLSRARVVSSEPEVEESTITPLRILVVDDSVGTRKVIANILSCPVSTALLSSHRNPFLHCYSPMSSST
jgi:hypothetical protein